MLPIVLLKALTRYCRLYIDPVTIMRGRISPLSPVCIDTKVIYRQAPVDPRQRLSFHTAWHVFFLLLTRLSLGREKRSRSLWACKRIQQYTEQRPPRPLGRDSLATPQITAEHYKTSPSRVITPSDIYLLEPALSATVSFKKSQRQLITMYTFL